MATNKYNEIEIQTAKNLLEHGYKWITMDESGGLFAYTDKPSKLDTFWCSDGIGNCVCYYVPIFQNIRFEDKEPTSLESIVHPQILDDAEKRYLSAVIRPFRNKVKYITKISCELIGGPSDYYCIMIGVVDEYFDIHFPSFSKDTMYKGMQLGYKYTLEELGL